MYEDWLEAEAEGQVPFGEDFLYWGIVELDSEGQIRDMPYDLCWGVRGYMGDANRRGVTKSYSPETIRGKDERGYTVVHAILPLSAGGYLIETVRTWTFNLPPVNAHELAEDVATVLVAEALRQYELGEKVPASPERLVTLRRQTGDWIREGVPLDDVPFR